MELAELMYGISLIILFVILQIYIGNRIYGEKVEKKKASNMIIILLYTLYLGINAQISGEVLKVILNYMILIIFYKMLYKKDWNKSIVGGFAVYCIMISSDIITAILLPIITQVVGGWSEEKTKQILIMLNIMAALEDLIIYKLAEKQIIKVVNNANKFKTQQSVAIYSVLLITATIILNKLSIINWTINFEFIINSIILIVFFGVLLYISTQTQRYDKVRTKYSELSTYSKINDELLEEYRMKSHEFNNQLAIIKSMTENKEQDLGEYVDTLIKKNQKNKYSWVNEVKYIQLAGLKGLINYKIMEMKSHNIKLDINISKEVKKFKFDNFTLERQDHIYSIVGVYLDNAMEAAIESKKKQVIIDIYIEKEEMIITIGNSYKGEINLSKIGDYNYTTKGKSRGVGLHLVKNIIKTDDKLTSVSQIRNNLFLQILYIEI